MAFRTAPLSKGRIVSTRGLAGRMVANWWLRPSQAQAFIRTEAHESKYPTFDVGIRPNIIARVIRSRRL